MGISRNRLRAAESFFSNIRVLIRRQMEDLVRNRNNRPASNEFRSRLDRKQAYEASLPEWKEKNCVICLENYKLGDEVVEVVCKHHYHFQCVDKWLERSNLCPVCKTALDV